MELLTLLKKYTIPYEKHRYSTQLSVTEVNRKLNTIVEPKKYFRFKGSIFGSSNHKDFEGRVNQHTFKIERIAKSKNNAVLIVRGELRHSLQSNTSVYLTLQPKIYSIFFLIIWAFVVFGLSSNFQFNASLFYEYQYPLLFVVLFSIVFTIVSLKWNQKK